MNVLRAILDLSMGKLTWLRKMLGFGLPIFQPIVVGYVSHTQIASECSQLQLKCRQGVNMF